MEQKGGLVGEEVKIVEVSQRSPIQHLQGNHPLSNKTSSTRQFLLSIPIFAALLSLILLILVEIGSISPQKVLSQLYFIRLDLRSVVPASVPDAGFMNSVAQSLGLKDFYQVGLWGFCDGTLVLKDGAMHNNLDECSPPALGFWFNPVDIMTSSLLEGATIVLPAEVQGALNILKDASLWMSRMFLAATVLTFISFLLSVFPLLVHSQQLVKGGGSSKSKAYNAAAARWSAVPFLVTSFAACLCTSVACFTATTIYVMVFHAFRLYKEVNVQGEIGVAIFALMWTSLLANWVGFWCVLVGACCFGGRG
ncbi:hypothetical protein BJ508DRAFT_84167 [Ascobolus immersus RN42]|uniref:SUR7-domain-containing protein n=1 Tax=Ascobolus immersus RN42 TaxID=1160509 RepID=A0A3N4I9L7_ASCIM|nr:hypothetical protein BJ508DRAFT_84167 [Ascobolus immersus RN42]